MRRTRWIDTTAPSACEPLEPRLLFSAGALIVTNNALADAFGDVAEWYTRKGYPAQVVTVEDISSAFTGDDLQEKVRTCIRQYHEQNDVQYVVLGGDNSVVPDRDTYVSVGSTTTYTMPTDLYYGSLYGTWDRDGDLIYGEAGSDSDSYLTYDVVVARYPVRRANEVAAILQKVIAYETNPPEQDWATEMLSTGARLWNVYGPGSYSGESFDHRASDAEIKAAVADDAYVEPFWAARTVDQLFDTYSSWDVSSAGDYDLTASNLFDAMSNGYQFMTMLTHGSYSAWGMESGMLTSTTVADLSQALNVPIISTIACNTGAYDVADPALSEAFLRSPFTGTIVYLGCSRYGWGYPTTSLGTSIRYTYEFYHQFASMGHRIAGEAFVASKEMFAPYSGSNTSYRWVQLGLNFQGDPLVQMYAADPVALTPQYDASLTPGGQTFRATGLPAGARVTLWQGDDVYTVGVANGSGVFSASISPVEGEMSLAIVAPDAPVYTDWIEVAPADPDTPKAPEGDGEEGGDPGLSIVERMENFFDEQFYLGQYPRAVAEIQAGLYDDAFDHYLSVGAYEHYSPSAYFDEARYLSLHAGLTAAIRDGDYRCGLEHFLLNGAGESEATAVSLLDGAYYLQAYPDVAAAVAQGTFSCALEHFTLYGQSERRRPSAYFSQSYYLSANADVAAAVQNGVFHSGYDHFARYGQTERRNASPVYSEQAYLAANPDVRAAVEAGVFRSGYEHFLRYGQHEPRTGAPSELPSGTLAAEAAALATSPLAPRTGRALAGLADADAVLAEAAPVGASVLAEASAPAGDVAAPHAGVAVSALGMAAEPLPSGLSVSVEDRAASGMADALAMAAPMDDPDSTADAAEANDLAEPLGGADALDAELELVAVL